MDLPVYAYTSTLGIFPVGAWTCLDRHLKVAFFFNAGSHQIGPNKRNAEIKDLLREIMALGESREPIVNVQRFDAEIRNSVQFLDVSALCLLFPIFIFFFT